MLNCVLQQRKQYDLVPGSDSDGEEEPAESPARSATSTVQWGTLSEDERRRYDPAFRFEQAHELITSLKYIVDQIKHLIVAEQRAIALAKKNEKTALGLERSRKNRERAQQLLRERSAEAWKKHHPAVFEKPSPATASQLERLRQRQDDEEQSYLDTLDWTELESWQPEEPLQPRQDREEAVEAAVEASEAEASMPAAGSVSSPVRVILNVQAADYVEVASRGAFFDSQDGWYVLNGTDLSPFHAWVGPHMV